MTPECIRPCKDIQEFNYPHFFCHTLRLFVTSYLYVVEEIRVPSGNTTLSHALARFPIWAVVRDGITAT